jgi:hypothetical protein
MIEARPFCIRHMDDICACWPVETAEAACAAGRHWSVLTTPDGNLCPRCKAPIMDHRYPRPVRPDAPPVVWPVFPPGLI